MSVETVYTVVENITTNGTLSDFILAIGSTALAAVLAYGVYVLFKHLNEYLSRITAQADNEMYLHNLYTSYKAGIVIKTAEEEKVILTPRPAEPEKNIADTLKDQVKAEISQ